LIKINGNDTSDPLEVMWTKIVRNQASRQTMTVIGAAVAV
jgi:hypothetical protein